MLTYDRGNLPDNGPVFATGIRYAEVIALGVDSNLGGATCYSCAHLLLRLLDPSCSQRYSIGDCLWRADIPLTGAS